MQEFLAEYWTREVFLARISTDDLHQLESELAYFDPVALIREHEGAVASVWFEDSNGHAQAVDMSPSDAVKFYNAGMTVFLPDINTATIERWRAELATSLGRPPRNFLSSLFLSKNGNVSGCHFDHIENFTVQLRGSKSWRIMKNPHAPLPTVNYSARAVRPYAEELWLYGTKPLPTHIAHDIEPLIMTPGSLLYVPRGHWHEVEAAADSISLLLAFPSYTWLDVVLPSLRTMLLRHSEWRENAIYPHDSRSWCMARHRLAQLCRDLGDFVEGLDPAEFLPHIASLRHADEAAVFRRNPLCTLGLYEQPANHVELVAMVHQGEFSQRREASVPAAWAPVIEQIDRGPELSEAALARQFPRLSGQVADIIRVLMALEVIRPAQTDVRGAARLGGEYKVDLVNGSR